MASLDIHYYRRDQLDSQRWDQCIDNAGNGNVYAYSGYLDGMAQNWDALVLNDYEAVMPLTWNRKWGIPYLYQPAFTAAAGVFGNGITGTVLQAFLLAIPRKFRLIEISLNSGNMAPLQELLSRKRVGEKEQGAVDELLPQGQGIVDADLQKEHGSADKMQLPEQGITDAGLAKKQVPDGAALPTGFEKPGALIVRNNYLLDLRLPYEALWAGYRDNIRRNIKKAQQAGHQYGTGIPVQEVIRLAQWQEQQRSGVKTEDYNRFIALYNHLLHAGQAMTCGVRTAGGELVASCVYFFSHKRAYYILVGNHPNGRTGGASHFLIDRFIQAHAGQELLLDFEGSDLRNLAFFYSSFGASLETYPAVRVNRLPWYVNLLRRG
ncbi:MAG: GNAT family N-acetyltransferase [Candidatus Pseudobacter hemicellulosilyticus]|uniref:GNAT family N-acetyltransferase n=1 Tax=Candidatus Pseudobacter hemicellulosilyticus TaxID=3121375 RepID=A0AAJ5WR57_9BACT|nr:MAG: GNAT family N-acetyltransferase [Pseudobacter sp.]